MQIGDLVKEKYYSERIGIIIWMGNVDWDGTECTVAFIDGGYVTRLIHNFWEVMP